ncbi:putative mitochondrial protein, partial [Tanacetum coccineum]
PIPSTLKQLRGFLGLTGYYRRFIKDYASISQPLVALTNKDAFKWNRSAELAYHKLKEAMIKALVLALPDFDQEFMVETDASGKGIGAVLCQNGHPIAYWSKTLSAKHQALSTYEKEFLAVVAALDKWKGYLLDRHFKIRTNHFSLKYMLNQKLTTPFQFKWLPKLLGYDYEIVYKKGSENVNGEILKRKGKVVVGNDLELRKELVQHFHDEAIGGHSGAHVTMKKLGSLFYWKGLKKMVKQMKEVFMDFIEKLPTSHGKSVILVVVDRLSKYAHFIPLAHPFTTSQVAQVFLDRVYKLHGLPESIKPKEWVKWLSLAEFWYNTNYHTSTKTTPYEAVYCQTPPIHVPYIPGDSRVEEVDMTFQAREEAIKVLKFHLKSFNLTESIRQGQQHKLSPKYYGPFKVAKRIGEVAYKLELPSSSQIHPVFHISQLKKCHVTPPKY